MKLTLAQTTLVAWRFTILGGSALVAAVMLFLLRRASVRLRALPPPDPIPDAPIEGRRDLAEAYGSWLWPEDLREPD